MPGNPQEDGDGAALDAELAGYYFEDLEIGMSGVYSRTITESDIVLFCGISGDTNPVHLNEEYAKTTMFKHRIAHGMLSGGFISAAFGTRMPGVGCIYVRQEMDFKAPVYVDDTVVAKVELLEKTNDKKGFTKWKTTCSVGDKVILDGVATIMVPLKSRVKG